MEKTNTFATVINCMDGRTQLPVNEWLRQHLQVDFVDTITIPGPDKVVSKGLFNDIHAIQQMVAISINKHGSKTVALVGHVDCAGNPCTKEEHLAQIETGINNMKQWGYPAKYLGLWVDENWDVHCVYDSTQ